MKQSPDYYPYESRDADYDPTWPQGGVLSNALEVDAPKIVKFHIGGSAWISPVAAVDYALTIKNIASGKTRIIARSVLASYGVQTGYLEAAVFLETGKYQWISDIVPRTGGYVDEKSKSQKGGIVRRTIPINLFSRGLGDQMVAVASDVKIAVVAESQYDCTENGKITSEIIVKNLTDGTQFSTGVSTEYGAIVKSKTDPFYLQAGLSYQVELKVANSEADANYSWLRVGQVRDPKWTTVPG